MKDLTYVYILRVGASSTQNLGQLCPTCRPVEGFVRPNLGLRCSISSLHSVQLKLQFN